MPDRFDILLQQLFTIKESGETYCIMNFNFTTTDQARSIISNWFRQEMFEIKKLAYHGIPFYAYGDNEAACDMASRLDEIKKLV